MSFNDPKLRGSAQRRSGPYPIGQFPDAVIAEIGKQIVHRMAVGQWDITGDDFGTIFAKAIGGEHRAKPLGLADVVLNGCAWSLKTVKNTHPFRSQVVRLISGRNSPDYSLGIANPHADPARTGAAVLSVWNARVEEALHEHNELRIVVMLRDMPTRQFSIFEEEVQRFTPTDFQWSFNARGNLEGHNFVDRVHHFTWQPHGSQFTVLRQVPASARCFSIVPNVPIIMPDDILTTVGFTPDWIRIHR